jgi:hypothetical protein
VNVVDFNENKELTDSENVLDFILTSLAEPFQMTSKQATGLLTNKNKYLVTVCVKGMKGSYEPVINWYESVYANSRYLVELLEHEEQTTSISQVLSILKSGMFSSNYEVTGWCCRLLSKIGYEMSNMGFLPYAWEWFVSGEEGGLDACIYAMRKHPDISESMVSVFTQFGKSNYMEMFTHHLRNLVKDKAKYIEYAHTLFYAMADLNISKEAILYSGVLDYWIEISIR